MPSCRAALSRVLPAMTSPVFLATTGCRQPKRRSDAATCSTASSLWRGLLGEQKRRSIATVSTCSGAVSDTAGLLARRRGRWLGAGLEWPDLELARLPRDYRGAGIAAIMLADSPAARLHVSHHGRHNESGVQVHHRLPREEARRALRRRA